MGILSCAIEGTPRFYSPCMIQDSINHGVNWIYTFTETLYVYEYKVLYFTFLDSIFDDSFDFYFNTMWYFTLVSSPLQLFFSFLLDHYVRFNLVHFHFLDNWYKAYLASLDSSLALIFFPELSLIKSKILSDYYVNYFTDMTGFIYDLVDNESFITPIMYVPQTLTILYAMTVLVMFYFSYYSSSVKEESTIDADYLSMSSTVESEKELGALDDLILTLLVFIYIFGWYFYLNCWTIVSINPELVLVFYLLPGLYYIIFSVPTYLCYDFGIFFLAYLRGVGPSPVLLAELMYDYIAFAVFYIKLFVQGVRLLLMIATYTSMHDLILFFSYDQKLFLGSELLWEDSSNLYVSSGSWSYFFLFSLPGYVLYWMYELLHTFFLVTAQLVAFFAMVFWLFLFLYTFFVFEQVETYFKDKRAKRKKMFNDLLNLKNKNN